MRGERKGRNKIIFCFSICVHTIPNLEQYNSLMPNFLAFKTSDVRGLLVFGVPNAKYLAFDTPDASALTCSHVLD